MSILLDAKDDAPLSCRRCLEKEYKAQALHDIEQLEALTRQHGYDDTYGRAVILWLQSARQELGQ
jgi:hypothetical protein